MKSHPARARNVKRGEAAETQRGREGEGRDTIARSTRNATLDVAYIIRALCVHHLCSRFDNPFYKAMTPVLPEKHRKLTSTHYARHVLLRRYGTTDPLLRISPRVASHATIQGFEIAGIAYPRCNVHLSLIAIVERKRKRRSGSHDIREISVQRTRSVLPYRAPYRNAYLTWLHHLENAQVRR